MVKHIQIHQYHFQFKVSPGEKTSNLNTSHEPTNRFNLRDRDPDVAPRRWLGSSWVVWASIAIHSYSDSVTRPLIRVLSMLVYASWRLARLDCIDGVIVARHCGCPSSIKIPNLQSASRIKLQQYRRNKVGGVTHPTMHTGS